MAFIPAPGCVRVHFRASYLNERVENSVAFKKGDAAHTPLELQELAGTLDDAWYANMRPTFNAAYLYRETYIEDLASATSYVWTVTRATAWTGTITDSPGLPGNVSFVVRFTSSERGRSKRGRVYLPAISQGQVNGNLLNLAQAEAFADGLNAVLDAPVADGWSPVILSYQSGGTPRATALVTPISGVSFSDRALDSRRKRLAGRGE